MCCISGIIWKDGVAVDAGRIRRMHDVAAHRGPAGVFTPMPCESPAGVACDDDALGHPRSGALPEVSVGSMHGPRLS
jgi:asparagine synthetase B (glutamine-hydrolysing)